jgi:DNA-binding transcriptional ArsR family regulator
MKRLEQMRRQSAAAEEMLKALANRHRLMILCKLIDGEHSVGEMAGFLEVRDSTVSQHLALLRKDGLVSTRREGQTIWYALASEPVKRLVGTLYDIYCGLEAISPPKLASGAKYDRTRSRTR